MRTALPMLVWRILCRAVPVRRCSFCRYVFRSAGWNVGSMVWNVSSTRWNVCSSLWNGELVGPKQRIFPPAYRQDIADGTQGKVRLIHLRVPTYKNTHTAIFFCITRNVLSQLQNLCRCKKAAFGL